MDDKQLYELALEAVGTRYTNGMTVDQFRGYLMANGYTRVSATRIRRLLSDWIKNEGPNGRIYYSPILNSQVSLEIHLDDELPHVAFRNYSEYPQIPAPALVVGDFHLPLYDKDWLLKVVAKAKELGVPRCIINGDLVDFTHLSRFRNERLWTTEQELEYAQKLVAWLTKQFETVHVLPGNHDDRMSKKLDGEVSTQYLLEHLLKAGASARLHVHWHHHAYVGNTWLVAHPKNYSVRPITPATEYAAKYSKNIAINHTHKWGIAEYNGYWAVEIGVMTDPTKTAYTHIELNKHPRSSQGALIIDAQERPILLHPRLI